LFGDVPVAVVVFLSSLVETKFHSQFIRTFSFHISLTLKEEFAALSMADIMRNVGVKSHCERKQEMKMELCSTDNKSILSDKHGILFVPNIVTPSK